MRLAIIADLALFFPGTRPVRVVHGASHNRRGFVVEQPDEEVISALEDRIEDDSLIYQQALLLQTPNHHISA